MTDELDRRILAKVADGFHTTRDVAAELHEPENKVRNHMISLHRFGFLDMRTMDAKGNLRAGYWFTIPEDRP